MYKEYNIYIYICIIYIYKSPKCSKQNPFIWVAYNDLYHTVTKESMVPLGVTQHGLLSAGRIV